MTFVFARANFNIELIGRISNKKEIDFDKIASVFTFVAK